MTEQRPTRGRPSITRPKPSRYVQVQIHRRLEYTELKIHVANPAVDLWVRSESESFGLIKDGPGWLLLILNPLYSADEVAAYLESYTEEEA